MKQVPAGREETMASSGPESLKPHTRAERQAVAHGLIPLWRRRLGDGLLDEMLDVTVSGRYQDLQHLRGVILAVVEGLEQQFRGEGVAVVDADLDPNLPNRRFESASVRADGALDA